MLELVDKHVSEACAVWHVGSNPIIRTNANKNLTYLCKYDIINFDQIHANSLVSPHLN